jgi:hypothetical protein
MKPGIGSEFGLIFDELEGLAGRKRVVFRNANAH